jgi:hypothetical protein
LPGHESISATQIIFDETTGLAAIMKLFEREPDDKTRLHTLLAPMMALSQPDESLAFPSGTTLIPRLLLRNAGSGPAQVALTVDWRSASKSGKSAFPQLSLSPGEVRVINLADQQSSVQTPSDASWETVKLAYTGRRADLVAVALSYDKTSRYGLQTPFSENISHLWAGSMWHVDATHNTLITTGNAGPEPTVAQATLFYNGGKDKYRLEKMLSPGQQLWLDVGELIRNQVPDSDGRVLPTDLMNGSYELRDLDHAAVGELYEGKLVIDKTYGHASYGCGSCCGYLQPTLNPNPFGGPPDIDSSDYIYATEQCGGSVDDLTYYGYSWASSNTAVATLPTRTLHTVAVGSATGSAQIKLEWTHPAPVCPTMTWGPQQNINVCPSSTSLGAVTQESLQKVFPTDKTGIGAYVAINVSPSTPSGVIVTETLSQGTNSCPTGFPNVCKTSSGGTTPSLSVGTAGTAIDGTPLAATPNVIWDEHTVTSGSSVLASGQSCSAT